MSIFFPFQSNLKLTINLIDQLFVIPLSNPPNISKYSAGDHKPTPNTASEPTMSNRNLEDSSFGSTFEGSSSRYTTSSYMSTPSSKTPPTSPMSYSDSGILSSTLEDVFLPSSPPRASSSPISLRRNQNSDQISKPWKEASSFCQESIGKNLIHVAKASFGTTEMESNALKSPENSTSQRIKGSVTICDLRSSKGTDRSPNDNHEEGQDDIVNPKDDATKVKLSDFTEICWNAATPDMKEDKEDPEQHHQCKKGDTPKEVFKVAALYVT